MESEAAAAAADYSYVDYILPEMQVLSVSGSTSKKQQEQSDRAESMSTQATKVVDLANESGGSPSFDLVDISAMASKALANLKTYQETVTKKSNDNGIFKPFDYGDGRIRYDDFAKTLNISSSGLGVNDSYVLASQLDRKKSGGLDYKSIYQNLEDLIKRTKQSPIIASIPFVSPIKTPSLADNYGTERDDRGVTTAPTSTGLRGSLFNRTLCSRSISDVMHMDYEASAPPSARTYRRAQSCDSGMRNRVREQLRELNSIIALDEGPNKHRGYFDDSQISPRKFIGKDVVKSSIVNQIRGRLSVLHHMLKKADSSNSGQVSFNEFCAAISKAGVLIPKNDLRYFFSEIVSRPLGGSATSRAILDRSLNDASTLQIDDFIKGCRSDLENKRLSAETFSMESVRSEDDRRIMKLLLRKTSSHEDPVSAIFRHIDPKNRGWFLPSQVRDGFQTLNVPLTDEDYAQLFKTLKKNNEGKINIHEFENFLQEKVSGDDQETFHQRKKKLLTNKRYTGTFLSDDVFHSYDQAEYYSSANKSSARYKELIWKKLQVALQDKNDSILRAFSKKEKKGYKSVKSLKTIPLNDLQSQFANEGIYLGDDDVSLLQYHLQKDGRYDSVPSVGESKSNLDSGSGYLQSYLQSSREPSEKVRVRGNDSNVSLGDVCDVLNISLSQETKNRPQVSLSNPSDSFEDGGIFASAKLSSMPVTIFDSKYENMPGYTKGMRYFHLPNNSRTSKKQFRDQPQAHTYEPSKFWLLLHSRPDTFLPSQGGKYSSEPISVIETRCRVTPAGVATESRGVGGRESRQMKYFSVDDKSIIPSSNSYSENYALQKRAAMVAQKKNQHTSPKRASAPSPPRIRTLKKQFHSQSNYSSTGNFY